MNSTPESLGRDPVRVIELISAFMDEPDDQQILWTVLAEQTVELVLSLEQVESACLAVDAICSGSWEQASPEEVFQEADQTEAIEAIARDGLNEQNFSSARAVKLLKNSRALRELHIAAWVSDSEFWTYHRNRFLDETNIADVETDTQNVVLSDPLQASTTTSDAQSILIDPDEAAPTLHRAGFDTRVGNLIEKRIAGGNNRPNQVSQKATQPTDGPQELIRASRRKITIQDPQQKQTWLTRIPHKRSILVSTIVLAGLLATIPGSPIAALIAHLHSGGANPGILEARIVKLVHADSPVEPNLYYVSGEQSHNLDEMFGWLIVAPSQSDGIHVAASLESDNGHFSGRCFLGDSRLDGEKYTIYVVYHSDQDALQVASNSLPKVDFPWKDLGFFKSPSIYKTNDGSDDFQTKPF